MERQTSREATSEVTPEAASREVPAPGLTETAEIWWDSPAVPAVTWSADGRRFRLVDGADRTRSLALWHAPEPVEDPAAVARVLAEGLAACDFPPTGDGAAPDRIVATLRAHGLDADQEP